MKEITRRDFLMLLGATGAAVAATQGEALWSVPDELVRRAERGPGIETFRNSVCQLCPGGCGIRVRLIDGIPVSITGNPTHPVSRGGICPQGSAGLDFLYHPDRVRGPMIRSKGTGGNRFEPIDWKDALEQVAERLRGLRAAGTPERVAFLVQEPRGLMHELISRFLDGFGSPNLLALEERRLDALPFEKMFGWKDLPQHDMGNAKLVLSFGADFLDDGVSPIHATHEYGTLRSEDKHGRGRLILVDSRYSLTGASADEFFAVRPGSHGAFALGVAYVLIKERYYDAGFVASHVSGFEPWVDEKGNHRPGFREYVLANYYPERVARVTGVPAEKIIHVARMFGRTRPALALAGDAVHEGADGLSASMAVLSLNVLVGNVERKGGLRVHRPVPFWPLPAAKPDATAGRGLGLPAVAAHRAGEPSQAGEDAVLRFCENVLADRPYPLDTVFVYGANPAFSHPYAKTLRKVLEHVPFVVSFAGIPDETAQYADVILPEPSFLEAWADSSEVPGLAFPHASVGPPLLKPLYDTRQAGDVVLDLARRVGPTVGAAVPFQNFQEALKSRLHGVFASGRGAVLSGSFEESWIAFLKERGWQGLVYESFEDFWKVLVERGGWWEPLHGEIPPGQAIGYPDRKVHLQAWENAVRKNEGVAPVWEVPAEPEKAAYTLLTFGVLSNRGGKGSFSPLLQEMFGYYHRVYNDSWVELHPEAARRHGIHEGDHVTLASEAGSLTTRAVLNPMMDPWAVAVPFGMGHTAGGRYARGRGVNPYELLQEVTVPAWGRPAKGVTKVTIARASG